MNSPLGHDKDICFYSESDRKSCRALSREVRRSDGC